MVGTNSYFYPPLSILSVAGSLSGTPAHFPRSGWSREHELCAGAWVEERAVTAGTVEVSAEGGARRCAS